MIRLKLCCSSARLLAIVKLLLDGRVEVRISQVDIRHKLSKQCLGALQAALECLDILWCGIPPPI